MSACQLGVPHDYTERPGGHTWQYWSNAVQYQVLFFASAFRQAHTASTAAGNLTSAAS